MARLPLKIGAIVKITQFGGWFRDLGQNVIWARVLEGSDDGDAHHYGNVMFIAMKGAEAIKAIGDDDWGADGTGWPLDREDQFTTVPESRVPNWVWTQAAKRQLMGETYDVGS